MNDEGTVRVKKLRIEYAGMVLFDDCVDELTWTDSVGGVSVVGKFKSGKSAGGVADLLGALAGKKPSVEERRKAYEVEKSSRRDEVSS